MIDSDMTRIQIKNKNVEMLKRMYLKRIRADTVKILVIGA